MRIISLTLALALATGASVALAQDEAPTQVEAPAMDEAPTTAPTTTEITVAADQSTPRGAIRVLTESLQAGDEQAVLGVIHADTEAEQQVASAMAGIAGAMAVVRDAATEKFGEAGAEEMGATSASALHEALVQLNDATETIEGDKATVTFSNPGARPAQLVQVDGQWKLSIGGMAPDADQEQIRMAAELTDAQARILRETAEEIRAGQYATPAAARDAVTQKTMQYVMQKQLEMQAQQEQAQPQEGPGMPPSAPDAEPAPAPQPEPAPAE